MNNCEIEMKIKKWNKNYIRDKDGNIMSYLWNGIVHEEIEKLNKMKDK